jgi:hypothetical protein
MTSSRKLCILSIFAGSFFLGVFQASAGLGQVIPEFGDLDRWGVLSLGSGQLGNRLSVNSVAGDVGIAGKGGIILSGNTTINGDLYYRGNGKLWISGNSSVTGALFHNQDSLLDLAVSQAIATSKAAAALPSTRAFTNLELERDQSTTLTGAPGETVVLSLRDFEMTGNSTLTLQGTATTMFIINVKRQFFLSGNARIVLSGGVTWNNVLFNVRGKGSDVRIMNQAHFEGVLMANRRTVKILGYATLSGSVIGNRVVLSGSATVTHPPVTSP